MKSWAGIVLSLALLATAGCATAPHASEGTATLTGDAAHPDRTAGWVSTSLYFGLGLADGGAGVSEAQWRAFLDKEVTPRFPDGLSVRDVYGQWRGKGQSGTERLRSKELLLLYPDGPRQRADVEAIRAAWKRDTGDQSVLRVTQPADVSF
ncbi:uncharacterized protein DUF3574 [Luteibacter rhizovicinus]|uniref:Uncharacterized protein DUF3574 n=1 Tax=Luteibacter rhizovicinus TaxID=242606 RepID=A0A4R3YGW5_9GAMM|nr:DUF3574 domain-containing protein [Luteibacter rhizovicinus]TCV91436.1 uncharacterized protein DUF3574 [Luteibacter rhizovicinus]